jgi:4-hydroxy-tetrahydrodipicolinate reductase
LIKVLLSGCNGKMGKVVEDLVNDMEDMEIVAGVDLSKGDKKYPVYKSFQDCKTEADVIIDFSHYSMTSKLIDYSVKTKTPAVICTTGLDESLIDKIKEASKQVALFRSGNMSLGINLIMDLAKKSAKVLAESFDIEIIEKHHNRKLDAPSGTAYMIADSINEELDNAKEYNFGRYGRTAKREKSEIGIHAVRGGTIVGEHAVIYAGPDEIIEIKHTAMSRTVFASGAVRAAKFLVSKQNGLYNMDHILK